MEQNHSTGDNSDQKGSETLVHLKLEKMANSTPLISQVEHGVPIIINVPTDNTLKAETIKLETHSKVNSDLEANIVPNFNFNNKTIQRAFIRKVYLILMLQLAVTFTIAGIFTFNQDVKIFAWNNRYFLYISVIGTLVLSITMAYCAVARRKAPLNYILLGVFTGLTSLIVGFVASIMNGHHVLFAIGITGIIFISLTIFTFQTKYDFTRWEPYLFVTLLVLLIFGWLLMYYPSQMKILIYSALVAILFSFYIIYDTQLILGGKHQYQLSPEEYIFAALNLYLDIINIFLSFMDIFNITSCN